MSMTNPRILAITAELDETERHYREAKEEYDVALVHYETSKARFASTREKAHEIMTHLAWYSWLYDHPQVKYTGSPIGDSILRILQDFAISEAAEFVNGARKYFAPWLDIEGIATQLEGGGFEFRTATIGREVNAALLKLKGVERGTGASSSLFRHGDADEILAEHQDFMEQMDGRKAERGKDEDQTQPDPGDPSVS